MWLEIETTEDSMVEAMCKKERVWLEVGKTEDSIVWWTQRIRSQDVIGGRKDR